MLCVCAEGILARHHQNLFEPKPNYYPKPSNV